MEHTHLWEHNTSMSVATMEDDLERFLVSRDDPKEEESSGRLL